MSQLKPDKSAEKQHILSVVLSSVVLFIIFGTVWMIKKFKDGVL